MRAVLAVLLLLAFVATTTAQTGFAGHWKSNYGDSTGNAPWYICVVPNGANYKFYATYSRIGYVEGDLITGSNVLSNGVFYEAGDTFDISGETQDLGGFHGTISLTLVNATYISGSYVDVITGAGTWDIYNVDNIQPDPTLCWSSTSVLSAGSIPNNGWANASAEANWDFCAGVAQGSGVDGVESSYDFADPPSNNVVGASFGLCYDNDRTCTLVYVEKIGTAKNEGQWLIHQVDANTVYAFGWTGYPNEGTGDWYNPNSDNFGFYIWTKAGSLSGSCDRNSYVYSAASSISVTAVLVAALSVLALLFV